MRGGTHVVAVAAAAPRARRCRPPSRGPRSRRGRRGYHRHVVAGAHQMARELIRAGAARARAGSEELVQVEDPHRPGPYRDWRLADILIAAAGLVVASPLLLVAAVAIRLESPRAGDLPPPARRAGTGCRSSCGSCARWSRAPSSMGAGPLHRGRRHAHHARRRGCCAASRSTSCPTWSTCSAARWPSWAPGRRCAEQVDRYTPHQRRRLEVKPGHHGLGAGQRAHVALVARADRARRLVRGPPLARPGPAHPRPHRQAAGHAAGALQLRSEAGLGLRAPRG